MEKAIDFEEALKATGYGKFNIALVLICGACLFMVNADAYSMGYLLPSAQCDLNLSTSDKGIISSVGFIGIICSSHLWGFLADTKGRKIIIIITLIMSFFCTLIASFVINFWIFAFMRFLSGFFIAGASATVYAYLGEFHGDKYRTLSITVASLFIAGAIAALPGIAWLVIPSKWSLNIFGLFDYKPWRFFLMLCSLPGLFIAGALVFFPESPKFLMLQGECSRALAVLRKVYAINTGKREDEFPVKGLIDVYSEEIIDDSSQQNLLTSMLNQTVPLFQFPHLFNTFIVCTLQFGLFAVSSGLLLWYPEIVNNMAENARNFPNSSITVCEAISKAKKIENYESSCFDEVDTSVFEQNLIIGVAYIIGTTAIALVINTLGKRTLLSILLPLNNKYIRRIGIVILKTFVNLPIILTIYLINNAITFKCILYIIIFVAVIFLILSGGSGIALCWITNRIIVDYLFVGLLVLSGISVIIVNAAVIELFPTYLRAMAMCISLMCGRLGSVAASSTIGIFLEMNCLITFLIFSSVCFVCAALSWWIPNHSFTTEK